jgi:hypothetical protein
MSEKLRFRKFSKPKPNKTVVVEFRGRRYMRYTAVADPLAEAKAKLDESKKTRIKSCSYSIMPLSFLPESSIAASIPDNISVTVGASMVAGASAIIVNSKE